MGMRPDELRMQMLKRGYLPIIGYRKNRKEKVETEEIYNYFGATKKRCRRLLLRWERLPEAWNAFALLGLIFMWLEFLLG